MRFVGGSYLRASDSVSKPSDTNRVQNHTQLDGSSRGRTGKEKIANVQVRSSFGLERSIVSHGKERLVEQSQSNVITSWKDNFCRGFWRGTETFGRSGEEDRMGGIPQAGCDRAKQPTFQLLVNFPIEVLNRRVKKERNVFRISLGGALCQKAPDPVS